MTALLSLLARVILWVYQPTVIVVTGAAGKSLTQAAIVHVLRAKFGESAVACNKGDRRHTLDMLAPVFLKERHFRGFEGSFEFLVDGFGILFRHVTFPKFLVLELGPEGRGRLRNLVAFAKPSVVVITAIGPVPAHRELFAGSERFKEEIEKAVAALSKRTLLVINDDDLSVSGLGDAYKGEVVRFGFSDSADIEGKDYRFLCDPAGECGTRVDIRMDDGSHSVFLGEMFGKGAVYAALAAAAVGKKYGMGKVEIASALGVFQGLPGRLRLVKGIKGCVILDDSWTTSASALHVALDVLRDIPAERKIAVIGDLVRGGKYAAEVHLHMGEIAGGFVHHLIGIGIRTKFFLDGARSVGRPEDRLKHFYHLDLDRAIDFLERLVQPGDVVLVTGSHHLKLGKVVHVLTGTL